MVIYGNELYETPSSLHQTYDKIILHIEYQNGESEQKVVELLKFGGPASVNIP